MRVFIIALLMVFVSGNVQTAEASRNNQKRSKKARSSTKEKGFLSQLFGEDSSSEDPATPPPRRNMSPPRAPKTSDEELSASDKRKFELAKQENAKLRSNNTQLRRNVSALELKVKGLEANEQGRSLKLQLAESKVAEEQKKRAELAQNIKRAAEDKASALEKVAGMQRVTQEALDRLRKQEIEKAALEKKLEAAQDEASKGLDEAVAKVTKAFRGKIKDMKAEAKEQEDVATALQKELGRMQQAQAKLIKKERQQEAREVKAAFTATNEQHKMETKSSMEARDSALATLKKAIAAKAKAEEAQAKAEEARDQTAEVSKKIAERLKDKDAELRKALAQIGQLTSVNEVQLERISALKAQQLKVQQAVQEPEDVGPKTSLSSKPGSIIPEKEGVSWRRTKKIFVGVSEAEFADLCISVVLEALVKPTTTLPRVYIKPEEHNGYDGWVYLMSYTLMLDGRESSGSITGVKSAIEEFCPDKVHWAEFEKAALGSMKVKVKEASEETVMYKEGVKYTLTNPFVSKDFEFTITGVRNKREFDGTQEILGEVE